MNGSGLPLRLACTEGVPEHGFIGAAVRLGAMSAAEVRESIRSTSDRLRGLLRIKNALSVTGETLLVRDCAGLIRIAPGLELEVAPKFLGANEPSWREDFFLIASVVRTGAILPRERLRAESADRGDLASLVGRAMVTMYEDNHRRPLRTYHRKTWHEFAADGEPDPEDLILPDPDGFRQEGIFLDRENRYNATIRDAARRLLPEIRNPATRVQLTRVVEALSPQGAPRNSPRPRVVPSRHRRWQQIYDISLQVLEGLGLGLRPDLLHSPGYVLRTWFAWEELLSRALQLGLGEHHVKAKVSYPLGVRSGKRIVVTPDVSYRRDATVLIDAKYRARRKDARTRIARADAYEVLAFMQAAGAKRTVLLYPRVARAEVTNDPPGSCRRFEKIQVGEAQILGLEVECRGIAASGFHMFAETLTQSVEPFLG
ncbi:MAG TPA: hypothetical protein VF092_18050 [Longimicrobium sp.]